MPAPQGRFSTGGPASAPYDVLRGQGGAVPLPLVDLTGAVVLRRELLAEGLSDKVIRRKLRTGELHRVRHGCYVAGDLWRSLGRADQHRLLVRAVLRTAHPSAVVSHVSSALEHGGAVWGVDLGIVHLTRLDGRTGRREAGVVQHRGQLDDLDVVQVNGVLATRPARAGIEVIASCSTEAALVTIDSLLHNGVLDRRDLVETNRRLQHWPRTLGAPVVLRLCDERIESPGESRTAYLCHAQGLPRPEPQAVVTDELGRVVGRVDFVWRREGVFLEFQGREKYYRFRRRGESLEDYLMREKRRIELICQLTGWVCIPITWSDLERPQVLAARIRKILATRRALPV